MSIQLKAGVGRRDITPAIGGQLMGYRPDHLSKSINDRLRVTAALFCQGDIKVMLVSAEVCLIQTKLSEKIRALITAETGVPHIILSATHTHSGPNTAGMAGWGDIDSEYCDSIFLPRIVEAAREAAKTLKPVLLGIGTVQSKVGINRRQHNSDGSITLGQNPWGLSDKTMTVLRFSEPSGEPVISIVHYGAHCTAAGMNTEITRDWPGVMIERLEIESGGPVMFINGAQGDVGPRLSNGSTTGDISHVREIGGLAALDAVNAWRNAKNTKIPSLSVIEGEINLPLKPRLTPEQAKKGLADTANDEVNISGQTLKFYKSIIEAYEKKIPEETCLTIPQTLIAFGDTVLVPFPFEIFSGISLRLREYSPFLHTLCLGCTNGSHLYLPTQDQLCLGGYEVDVFRTGRVEAFADDTDQNIISENLRLLKELYMSIDA